MSNILKVELDTSAVRDLLRSSAVADVCETEAARRSRATGVKYVPDVYYGRNRVNAGGHEAGEET